MQFVQEVSVMASARQTKCRQCGGIAFKDDSYRDSLCQQCRYQKLRKPVTAAPKIEVQDTAPAGYDLVGQGTCDECGYPALVYVKTRKIYGGILGAFRLGGLVHEIVVDESFGERETNKALCRVCAEMLNAVEGKPGLASAQREYEQEQARIRRILGEL